MFDSPERGPWALDKGWDSSDGGVYAFRNGAESSGQGVGLVAGARAPNVIKAHIQGPVTEIWFGHLKRSQEGSPATYFLQKREKRGVLSSSMIYPLSEIKKGKTIIFFLFRILLLLCHTTN